MIDQSTGVEASQIPPHLLVINTHPRPRRSSSDLCNNKDILLMVGYYYNLFEKGFFYCVLNSEVLLRVVFLVTSYHMLPIYGNS